MDTDGERTALITGAGQGLGAAIARALYDDGMRVALLDIDGAAASRLAAGLDSTGDRVWSIGADVRRAEALEAAVRELSEHWESPDVLINNAARTVQRSVWDIPLEEWDDVLATNLRSAFVLTRLCAPAMRQRGRGRIVNLASLAGQQGGQVAGAHYAASKSGLLVLTKIFAGELAPHGVTVNAVAPAAVRTPAMDAMPEQAVRQLAEAIPVGRVGRAEEVASLVSYLCGPDTGYITGATFDINGGMFMR